MFLTDMDHLTHILPSSSSRNSSSAVSTPDSTTSMTKPNTESSKCSKRKGTRSVSTLTPAQLARKRANDREAQRAIRARTKEHIENLEREIDELRSQKSRDQTVQDLLGRNRALEDEVRRLRESLRIRTTGHGMPYPTSYNNSSSQPSSYGHTTPEYPMVSDMPPYSNIPDTTNVWPSSVPCSLPSTVSSPSSPGAPEEYGNNYFPTSAPSTVMKRSSLPPGMNSPAASCMGGGDMGFDDVKPATSRVWMPTTGRHRTNFSNISSTAVECVSRVLPSISGANLARDSGSGYCPSYWEIPVLTSLPSCQEDAIISSYIDNCRHSMNQSRGNPHSEAIFGPKRLNLRHLLHVHTQLLDSLGLQGPQTQVPSGQPLVDIVTAIFDKNSLELPLERVGNFILFRALIAWMVQPTRDTYIGLRGIFPPQPNQQTNPHPQWMDFILWPRLRSAIVARQEMYNTAEFRHIYASGLRLKNWPVTIAEAFAVDFSVGSIYPTDEFWEHAWDLRNWDMNESFTRRYPELEACLEHGWSV
ncbi:hypothetical protein HD806DRAFT_127425 [Xylariaceae sp. AK1471]|nr:hypothetical protein HD806DRAFT_127425 [Xylariaceae sp. AK1471]